MAVKSVRRAGNWRQFIRLIQQTKPSKLMLGIAIAMSVLTTLVGLLIPLFTKSLVNGFSLASVSPLQIVVFAGVLLAQAISNGVSIYLLNRVG
jgi:ATP-binding cassette, subfamily B, bacterial AbcA/BmrA